LHGKSFRFFVRQSVEKKRGEQTLVILLLRREMSSGRYHNNDNGTRSSSTTATNNNHNNRRYYQSNLSSKDEEKEEMNNDENAQPGKNHHSYHFQHQQKSSASTTTAKELLHRARSEIVNQVRKDIRNSSNTSSSSSHGGDFRREREALKENNTNTKDGLLGFQSRFPSAFGGAQNIDGNDEQQHVAREKQRLEEKRRKAQMAETSLHEKMDETKERIMERAGGGRSRAAAANTNTHTTTHHSSKNVSQWMDSVVAKARHDASMSPPLQQHSRNNNNSSNNNSSATESLREAAKNAREAVTRAVYGTATARHDEGKENTPPPVVRRSFSDPSPSSTMNYQQQHEETDAKVTKAMLKSALKQTGELRTELRETKLTLDGVKENLETAENDLKKERENREEDKLNFEAAKNELETSREAAREALAREVSVTQELTKKLSAKRDEALEQRNLADKFKRELEQLRSELRNLKNENESWIRKAEAANETSRRRSGDQQKDVPKVSSSFPQQQQQRPQQNEQQKVNATTTTTTTAQTHQSQQQQQVNWSRERREAEELKTKGNRAFHANKFDEALQSYTAALQVNFEDQPFRAVLHANRAAALQSLKKHLEAIVACCESQFFDKSYVRAIQRRADAYLSIGDWTMAAKDLEALVPIMGKECDAKLREVKMNIQRGVHIEHYAVLGVSSRANASEIRASYLKKSLKHHPDKAETEHTKEIAELMFKRVVEAYKVLSDANARRAYDNKRILGSSNAYNRRY
jgi:DnaJ family protein C protein 7